MFDFENVVDLVGGVLLLWDHPSAFGLSNYLMCAFATAVAWGVWRHSHMRPHWAWHHEDEVVRDCFLTILVGMAWPLTLVCLGIGACILKPLFWVIDVLDHHRSRQVEKALTPAYKKKRVSLSQTLAVGLLIIATLALVGYDLSYRSGLAGLAQRQAGELSQLEKVHRFEAGFGVSFDRPWGPSPAQRPEIQRVVDANLRGLRAQMDSCRGARPYYQQGAVVEDVRTVFERRNDATIYIPDLEFIKN